MASVARRGDVVRRSTGPWSPAVHALLRHLESVGFDRAPRLLGVDDAGRELLSFLAGRVPTYRDWRGDDTILGDVGRLLRGYHEATATFPFGAVGGWDTFYRERTDDRPEVICHNDFAFYNCVLVDGKPWGIIDFDGAAPGSRRWDLAATACGFVSFGAVRPADQARRLRLLCAGYGWSAPADLVGPMLDRLRHVERRIRAVIGTDAPQAAAAPSALGFVKRQLRTLDEQRSELEAALR